MRTIEEMEAELARQDAELERATAGFEEGVADRRHVSVAVPPSFFDDLRERCEVRTSPKPMTLMCGLRA